MLRSDMNKATQKPALIPNNIILRDYITSLSREELETELSDLDLDRCEYYLDSVYIDMGEENPPFESDRIWFIMPNDKSYAKTVIPEFEDICKRYQNGHTKRK